MSEIKQSVMKMRFLEYTRTHIRPADAQERKGEGKRPLTHSICGIVYLPTVEKK
jgi:hypothetical protein